MANIKISELNELTQKENNDFLPIVDSSANETKKISVGNLTPSNDKLVHVGTSVDGDYRVNFLKGENLFDGTLEDGSISNTTGENTNIANRKRTANYIPVKPNTIYTLSYQISAKLIVLEYNANKGFIQAQPQTDWYTTPYTFTTSASTKYIRFIADTSNLTTAMLNEGSTAQTYEPYITPSINVDNEEIYSKPVVLFNDPNGQFDDIILNDSRLNYSKLEVYYVDDQDFQNCMILDNSNKNFQLQFVKSGSNRGSMYFIATRFYYTSQTIFKRGTTTIYNLSSGVITENTTADVLKITKIIGYK